MGRAGLSCYTSLILNKSWACQNSLHISSQGLMWCWGPALSFNYIDIANQFSKKKKNCLNSAIQHLWTIDCTCHVPRPNVVAGISNRSHFSMESSPFSLSAAEELDCLDDLTQTPGDTNIHHSQACLYSKLLLMYWTAHNSIGWPGPSGQI